jgi:predicted nucleic acid-binding Zn ribbon protein
MTSPMVVFGPTVNGSRITPASKFLTCRTSAAWRSTRHVLVEDADAAELGHGDRQARFGDGVHGRRDDRQVQASAAGQRVARLTSLGSTAE